MTDEERSERILRAIKRALARLHTVSPPAREDLAEMIHATVEGLLDEIAILNRHVADLERE